MANLRVPLLALSLAGFTASPGNAAYEVTCVNIDKGKFCVSSLEDAQEKCRELYGNRALVTSTKVSNCRPATTGAQAVTRVGLFNGTYIANDGSELLVEEVPVNEGQRLTFVIVNVELSISRISRDQPFVYKHDQCTVFFFPKKDGMKQAFSVDATGRCLGQDAPLDSLSIYYVRK